MQQLFRFAQRFKPEVSVEQYAPLLRAAFEEIETAPNPPTFDDPTSPEVIFYLQQQSAYWERVNARRLELEGVRPEHRLSRLHEESVKYFRGIVTVLNILAESTSASLRGNFSEARRKESEAESWAPVLLSVTEKMANAMKRIQADQPTLFAMLGLPTSLLLEFGVIDELP